MSDDLSIVQWLFDTDVFTKALNWPANVERLVLAKRELSAAAQSKPTAAEVLASYQKFAGAIGPSVMNMLLQSDDAFPEVNHSGKPTPPSPGKVTLYVDPTGKRVLAECTKEYGVSPKFSVE